MDPAIVSIMLLLEKHEIDPALADLRLRRLSARRTDLRDARMAIIETQAVTGVPTDDQIGELRARVASLYNWNKAANSIDGLVSEAIDIATS